MTKIMKPRCVLCSDGYLQDVLQVLYRWEDVENVSNIKIKREEDRWIINFQSTDEALLNCIDWWTLKLNWQPLKIGLYYI